MPLDERDLFRKLDPGPGGLGSLRQKIRDAERSRREVRRITALAIAPLAAGMAVASVLTVTSLEDRSPKRRWGEVANPALIRFGLAPSPREAVTILPNARGDVAALRVGSGDGVAFYWVASRSASGAPDGEE